MLPSLVALKEGLKAATTDCGSGFGRPAQPVVEYWPVNTSQKAQTAERPPPLSVPFGSDSVNSTGRLKFDTGTVAPPGVLNARRATPEDTAPLTPTAEPEAAPGRATSDAAPQVYGSNATVWKLVTTPPLVASPA